MWAALCYTLYINENLRDQSYVGAERVLQVVAYCVMALSRFVRI